MTSAVSFFDVRDSFQDVKTPKTSTSASSGKVGNRLKKKKKEKKKAKLEYLKKMCMINSDEIPCEFPMLAVDYSSFTQY